MAKNQLNIYHRAYKTFQASLEALGADRRLQETLVAEQRELKANADAAHGGAYRESLDATRFTCDILTDWIEQIEFSLPYVEKAILENRQFILQNGEVVLIEKVRRISKPSVQHLARHSEMITHEPEPGSDLVPDKIYVTENDDNYAVYENRFLYLLLCELQEFVNSRYGHIVKTWNTFSYTLELEKSVHYGKRTMTYGIKLTEKAENDETTAFDGAIVETVKRIRNIQKSISALINLPLMKEVSHAPMLKPPITRTNILRMDTNFREAVVLYDFIVEYRGDGYTVNEQHNVTEPLAPEALRDMGEALGLLSYLSYRHGGGLDEKLEEDYLAEERQLAAEHEARELERLAALKAELASSKKPLDKYVLALEDTVEQMKKQRMSDVTLTERLGAATRRLSSREDRISELEHLTEEQKSELLRQKDAAAREAARYEHELLKAEKKHAEELEAERAHIRELEEQLYVQKARIHAIKYGKGEPIEEDLTDEKGFRELEAEYAAFGKFFEERWKLAKKAIRKSVWKKVNESPSDTDDADEN